MNCFWSKHAASQCQCPGPATIMEVTLDTKEPTSNGVASSYWPRRLTGWHIVDTETGRMFKNRRKFFYHFCSIIRRSLQLLDQLIKHFSENFITQKLFPWCTGALPSRCASKFTLLYTRATTGIRDVIVGIFLPRIMRGNFPGKNPVVSSRDLRRNVQ